MVTETFDIQSIGQGHLMLMPCPDAQTLEQDLLSLKQRGITHVVSLLEVEESERLGVADEGLFCDRLELAFTHFPIPDHDTPEQPAQFRKLADNLYARLQDGEHIIIHCYAGIGRAGLLAGALLIADGMTANDAAERLSGIRGFPVPQTHQQYLYLLDFETGSEKKNTEPERSGNWFTRWLSPA